MVGLQASLNTWIHLLQGIITYRASMNWRIIVVTCRCLWMVSIRKCCYRVSVVGKLAFILQAVSKKHSDPGEHKAPKHMLLTWHISSSAHTHTHTHTHTWAASFFLGPATKWCSSICRAKKRGWLGLPCIGLAWVSSTCTPSKGQIQSLRQQHNPARASAWNLTPLLEINILYLFVTFYH